ncbi:zinc metalloproteinase-disintegrin-like batroxstatin-1 isoform X2 [Megalops cyprinoides]|uniref:zinc metalloproteinase-disintegrin-like batroxstatin-1 isoform X2 n=1 Tax=Megalops cyprinoides TaxID=118141 RepID=UPI001863C1AE|nr:zinc metalloproteinase-disintegrin-like batroxstatin-1 isoform X2 [Megalops cyprinoides]
MTMTSKLLLLWICTLAASLDPSGLHPDLDGQEYEVVRPVRLHTLHKRDTESIRPEVLKYRMKVDGKDIEMQLQKNTALLTKDYSETHYTEDGTQVTSTPQDLDHCYYHGRIVNDDESMVSMSTCDGLRGYFKTAEQRYLIEPLSADDTGDHAVLKYETLNTDPPVCGVTNTSWDPDYPPSTSKMRSRASGPSLFQQQKYVELYVVGDNRLYKKMKNDYEEVRKKIFEVVNFVNMVYKPLNTFIAITGMEVWTDNDKISVTPPAGATLDAFTSWRNNMLKNKPHDNAQLITDIDFEGSTVGLAFIGTLCSGHSTGVIQNHNTRAIAVGATLAHEMGHNLGMSHDTSSCTCTGNSCIMAPALSYDTPRQFSSCSDANYEQFLTSRNPQCLFNKPDFMQVLSPPVCGNGFLERGEQCDCGTVEECKNPCCNATTCTLTKGSECATGECCDNCKFAPSTTMCRRQQDDCDLAEYCKGTDATCPEDVFAVNGKPCQNGQGYCINGHCPRREDQCIKMWGDTAEVAGQFCYNQNTRGAYFAYCKRQSAVQYIGCQQQDIMCGKLFCIKGNDNPNYGRSVTIDQCKATFYGDPDMDFGQVEAGTKCGDEQVCHNYECVDLETAYRSTNCSARCRGHAVCNHKLECQCLPGWLPPNCETKDQNVPGGLSPGAIVGIAVAVGLLILIIVAVIGATLVKRRRKQFPSHRYRPPTHKSSPGVSSPGVNNPAFSHQMVQAPHQENIKPMRPKGPPPPPPLVQSRPPPYNLAAARQALRPPPPRV